MVGKDADDQMMKRFLLVCGCAAILLSYQNCANPSNANTVASGSLAPQQQWSYGTTPNSPNDGQIHLDDPTNSSDFALQFVQTGTIVVGAEDSSLELDGLCSPTQDGAQLRYSVSNSQDVVVASDLVLCHQSRFHVSAPISSLACGETGQVSASLGTGTPARIVVQRTCANN